MSTIHITKHYGKLEGLRSISVPDPEFCTRSRTIPGSICASCYVPRIAAIRPVIGGAIEKNRFLTERPITEREIPILNDRIFRFNSFGELHNVQHLLNLYYIAELNPDTTFSLWTKRADIVRACPKPKPRNVILIQSVMMLDTADADIVPEPWADYIYSVRTTGEPCGEKCIACKKCYTVPSARGEIIHQLKH